MVRIRNTVISTLALSCTLAASAVAEPNAWPQAIIDRPLTLPEGAWSGGVDLSADKEFDEIAIGMIGLWGLSYGITNDLSAGLSYNGIVKPSEANFRGSLALNVGYTYYAEGPLILTANTNFGYDFFAEAAAPFGIGSLAWYNVLPWLALISYGDQFVFELAEPLPGENREITFQFPIAAGFQIIKPLFFQVETNVVSVSVRGPGETAWFGADSVPVAPSIWFSPFNYLDFFAGINFEAAPGENQNIGDTINWNFGFLYFGNVSE